MARAHLAHVVVDQDGDIQANKTVLVFEANGTTPYASNIYAAVTGGVPLVSMATDSLGLIELFTDEADARRAKLTIDGVAAQTLTDFYPDAGEIVTLTKTQTLTNKTLTSPTLTTPTATGGTFTTPTIVTPTINGAPIIDVTGTFLDFREDSVAKARMWGDSGVTQGSWSWNVPLTIRDDGTPGNLYDQSNSGYMLMVQRNISTKQSCTLVPISAYSQATTGDNSAFTAKYFQDGGGATVNTTCRAVDFESFLHSDAGANNAVPVVGMELGIHPGWRFPFRMGSTVDNWDYTELTASGTDNESATAKVFINMFAATDAWRSDLGLDATEIIYRHGTGLLIHGQEGFDRHILIRNENDQDTFEINGMGRLRQRPSAFTSVIYQAAGPVYTDRSTNASQTAATGTGTVELPTGGGNRVYIAHRSPFSHVHVDIATAAIYSGGVTATLTIEYYNGSSWANLTTAQPANGSVVTDGTAATSSGGDPGPFVQSGTITFAPPTGWKKDAPAEAVAAGVVEALYWIRVLTAANAADNSPTAAVIRPGSVNCFEVYAGNLDTVSAFLVDANANVQVNGRLRYSDELVHTSAKTQTKSANYTMTAADSGYVTYIDTDAFTITLPDCTTMPAGTTYTFVNVGGDGTVLITISPNANDMIQGVGLTGANDKDILNTKATAKHGDLVTIVNDKVDGWVVSRMHGTWARQA